MRIGRVTAKSKLEQLT